MTKHKVLGVTILAIGGLALTGCEQTMRTGRVGNTSPNAPNPDGTCPPGLGACGKANFTKCLDLQTDPEHCGTCDNACVPGIACVAGTCQQIACNGPVTLSPQTIATGGSTTNRSDSGAILADVNGDGRLDLVSWSNTKSYPEKGDYEVALGEAGGGFGAPSIYQATTSVQEIVAGDANADGFQDLFITATFDSPCVEIWLGHADGRLTPTANTGVTGCFNTIAIGDLNGDGRTDVVTPCLGGFQVYLADGNGVLQGPQVIGAWRQVNRVILQDWNGDGSPDLVVISSNDAVPFISPTLTVHLNKGNGTFNEEMDCNVFMSLQGVVIMDFNRDGHLDVALGTQNSGVGVLLGMGGCQFQPMTEYSVTRPIRELTPGDLNGDGLEDLVAQSDDGSVSLLLGVGDGTFQLAPSLGGRFTSSVAVMVAEVTGDGKADIVLVLKSPGSSQILRNTCP